MNTQYDQFGRPIWSEPELYDDPSPNAFSLAALVCGILAILSICVGGAIIPAALGILFALLSRKTRMCGQAKVGFFLSIGSMALYVLALLFLIGTLALTGILGPLTEKALTTDFTDPASVTEFQEETYRLLDSLMERYSKFLPEETAQAPTKEQVVILSAAKNLKKEQYVILSAAKNLKKRQACDMRSFASLRMTQTPPSVNRKPKNCQQEIPQDPVAQKQRKTDPQKNVP